MAANSAVLNVPAIAPAVELTGAESGYSANPSQTITINPLADIRVGGVGVTLANGLLCPAGQLRTFECEDKLFALAPVATTVSVLRTGVA